MSDYPVTYQIDSPRAAGNYLVDEETAHWIKENTDGPWRARLTTWLIDQRSQGAPCPTVTRGIVEAARSGIDMPVPQRADRILLLLAQETTKAGTPVELNSRQYWQGRSDAKSRYLKFMAHSESVGETPGDTRNDLHFLLRYLASMGWIEQPNLNNQQFDLTLSALGFGRVAALTDEVNPESDQVFVAMWIHDDTADMWEKGIKPAIANAGYKAIRVDEQHYVGNVVGKIITEIRRSRFIVVDYTEGSGGTRGSVYYEAGFARV